MNKNEAILDWDYIHEIFEYNPDTGILTNKFTRSSRAVRDNEAGTLGNDGYLKVRLNNIEFKIHRLVWFYEHAVWPANKLDHKNRNKLDNRLINLRESSSSQNNCNRTKKVGCSSKYKGVYLNGKKWLASICVKGKRKHLGMFIQEEDAALAYNKAAIIYHKEFAVLNSIPNKK